MAVVRQNKKKPVTRGRSLQGQRFVAVRVYIFRLHLCYLEEQSSRLMFLNRSTVQHVHYGGAYCVFVKVVVLLNYPCLLAWCRKVLGE